MSEARRSAEEFLELIRKSRLGKLKLYIGMSAGVGKSYRMLQEAHALLKNGIDVKIGFVETHQRKETEELLAGLPVIPRKTLYYKGKALEEMDLQAILNLRPEVVIVDELAHTNVEGSLHEKRWQDVMDILASGINVISAVNIQHIESLNEEIMAITGIEVKERVPDTILAQADEVVNIDLTADELLGRLKEGKIYPPERIQAALAHFFQRDHILRLRELALTEVASYVKRKVEVELPPSVRQERLMACISSNGKTAKHVIRKTARLAGYYQSQWYVLYVQTPGEALSRIPADKQRLLIHNLSLATELGAEIIKISSPSIVRTILEQAGSKHITTVCVGKPRRSLWAMIPGWFNQLLNRLSGNDIDLIILS